MVYKRFSKADDLQVRHLFYLLPKQMLTKPLRRTSSEWARDILKYFYAIQRNTRITSKVGNHSQVDIKGDTIVTTKGITITLGIRINIKVVMAKESILVEVALMEEDDMKSILIRIGMKITGMVDTITEMTLEILQIMVDSNNRAITENHINLDMERKVRLDMAMINMEANLLTIRLADHTIVTISMIQVRADTITGKETITIAVTNPMINQHRNSKITAALIHMDNSINKTPLQLLLQLIHLSNKTTNIMGSNINILLQQQTRQQRHLLRSIYHLQLLEVMLVIHSINNILKVTNNNSMPSSITNKEFNLNKMHIHNSNSSIPSRLKLVKLE